MVTAHQKSDFLKMLSNMHWTTWHGFTL